MDNVSFCEKKKKPTVSIRFEATAAFVTPPALMLARTGAPNPIEESWRLEQNHSVGLSRYFDERLKGIFWEFVSLVIIPL